MERYYLLSEVQTHLKYKDRRSVLRWCENNGVDVFCHKRSNRHFVIKEQFEKAFTDSMEVKNMKFNEEVQKNHKSITYKPTGIKEKYFYSQLLEIV